MLNTTKHFMIRDNSKKQMHSSKTQLTKQKFQERRIPKIKKRNESRKRIKLYKRKRFAKVQNR